MSKTVEQIDADLADWQKKLGAANLNVDKLRKDVTWLILTGNPPADVIGVTKEKVNRAKAAVEEVIINLPLVINKITEAQTKRDNMARFFNAGTIAEIVEMLEGESIVVEVKNLTLAQTGLFSGSQAISKTTPQKLLEAMVKSYEEARDVVVKITEAWEKLEPFVEKADEELTAIEKSVADKLNVRIGNQTVRELIASSRKQVETWRANWRTDPLGTHVSVTAITDIRKRLEEGEGEHGQYVNKLTDMRAKLARLQTQGCDQTWLQGLERWLGELQKHLDAGNFFDLKKGIPDWITIADHPKYAEKPAASKRPTVPRQQPTSQPQQPARPPQPQPPENPALEEVLRNNHGSGRVGTYDTTVKPHILEEHLPPKKEEDDLDKVLSGSKEDRVDQVLAGKTPTKSQPATSSPSSSGSSSHGSDQLDKAMSTKKDSTKSPDALDDILGAAKSDKLDRNPPAKTDAKPDSKTTVQPNSTQQPKKGDPLDVLFGDGKKKPSAPNAAPNATPDKKGGDKPASGTTSLDDLFKKK